MPADVESHGRSAVANPYRGAGPAHNLTGANLVMDKLQRLVYIVISGYILHRMNFVSGILRSPHVRHEWFKVGLAGMIATVSIKAYVELYEGMLRKKSVNYRDFKHTTHAAIILIFLTTIAFHIALWPYYGWNTPIALGCAFFGVIVQFLVIVPVWAQNIVTVIGLTWFLQEYQ